MCRTWGRNGRTREVGALLDFNNHYCCISRNAALDMGFSEGASRASSYEALRPDRVPLVVGMRGLEKVILITLPKVSVSRLEVEDVETVVFDLDLPMLLPADMVLGRTFLKNFKLTIDSERGYLSLDRASPGKPGLRVGAVEAGEVHPRKAMASGESTR